MFYASGLDGQATFIIPWKKSVVIRLGLAKAPGAEYKANNLKTILLVQLNKNLFAPDLLPFREIFLDDV
jgi:hypothetical protein